LQEIRIKKYVFWGGVYCDPKASFEPNFKYPCPKYAICLIQFSYSLEKDFESYLL